jgi:hypothetical protein
VDWSNEIYVRLYTRDSATWLKMRWEGQCLLMALLRKVDRAGVLDGVRDVVDDLSLVTGLPPEVVAPGIERLQNLGVVAINNNILCIPKFLNAQECCKSDKLRQREARDRRRWTVTNRDASVTNSDASVTNSDQTSRAVTDRHGPSRTVTDRHSLPCFALPYIADPDPISDQSGIIPTDTDTGQVLAHQSTERPKRKRKPRVNAGLNGSEIWDSYAEAYQTRYGASPIRNARQNALCCQLRARLGGDAPAVAAYYLSSRNAYYTARGHALAALITDAEKVRTEWATGKQITQTAAREGDRLSKEHDEWQKVISNQGEQNE